MVISAKSVAQQLVATVLMVVVVVAFANSEPFAGNMIIRKLKLTNDLHMPQPNCAGVDKYCDLATFCCGQLTCKRNPGIFDYSGTCVDVEGCGTEGARCGLTYGPCCTKLWCRTRPDGPPACAP